MALPVVQPSDFVSWFPEFANYPQYGSAYVTAMNPVAALFVSSFVFPAQAQELAQALIIAHWAKLDQLNGGGALVTDKVGDVMTGQQPLKATFDDLGQTTYGLRFKNLARIFRIPTQFVGGGGMRPLQPFSFPQQTWTRGPYGGF